MKFLTIQSFVSAALLVALTGCSFFNRISNQIAGDSNNVVTVSFPDPGKAWLKGGTFVNVDQLRRISQGMTKNQVRELISYPHFNEGLLGSTEWDYLFNFRTGRDNEFVTCQFKVFYKNGITEAMFWKDQECASFLVPRVGVK